jgi:hypothetical protein
MTNSQCLGLAVAILAGFAGHALLDCHACRGCPGPAATASQPLDPKSIEIDKLRIRSMETLGLIQRGAPNVLHMGSRQLLVNTNWKQDGGDFKVTTEYYELKDGSLVRVPLVEEPK